MSLGFLYIIGTGFFSCSRGRAGRPGAIRHGSAAKAGSVRGSLKTPSLKTGNGRGGVKQCGTARGVKSAPQKAGSTMKASGTRSHSTKSGSFRHGSQRSTTHQEIQGAVGDPGAAATEVKLAQPAVNADSADRSEQLYFLILRLFNPLAMALFTFSFGAGGLVSLKYQISPVPSYVQACAVGLLFTWFVQKLMDWVISKLDTGTCDTVSDAIGMIAEVSVSIPSNGTGEVVLVLGQCRRNYPARAFDSYAELRRGSKVVIVENEGKIFFVESFDSVLLGESPP